MPQKKSSILPKAIRQLQTDKRLSLLEKKVKELEAIKAEESKVVGDLLFSVNGIFKAFGNKKLRLLVILHDTEGFDPEGEEIKNTIENLRSWMTMSDVITQTELMIGKHQALKEFEKEMDAKKEKSKET